MDQKSLPSQEESQEADKVCPVVLPTEWEKEQIEHLASRIRNSKARRQKRHIHSEEAFYEAAGHIAASVVMNDFDRFMDGDLPLRELVYWAREEAEQDLLVDMLSGLLGAIIRGRLTSEQRVKFGAFVDMAACDEAQLALESAYSRGTVSAATLLRSLPQDELVEMTQSAIDSLPQIAEREARYAENRSTRAAAPAAQPDSP